MKKIIYKIFSVLFVLVAPFLVSFCYWLDCWNGDDLLNCIFEPAKQRDSVIDFWDDKSWVWHTVLRESSTFSWWEWFYKRAPVIVKVVKIILKFTIVISVTMVIFYSIKFMLQVFKWNDYKSAWAKKDLINLFIWLLIALFSVTAITLVISISKSTF